jgi:hypothetical protein
MAARDSTPPHRGVVVSWLIRGCWSDELLGWSSLCPVCYGFEGA